MRPSRLALPALLAGTVLGIAAPAHAATSLMSVGSSTITGQYECRGGYPSPECDAMVFDRSADLAFSGNGSAQPAVAYDTIAGFPAIHQPSFANDGFYGNGSSWIGASAGSWVKIDLGRRVRVDRVRIGRDRLGGLDDRDPGRFTIATATADNAYANGDDSNDAAEYSPQFDSQPFDPFVTFLTSETLEAQFDPVVARYVKVQVSEDGAALDEIEVRGLPDTVAPELTTVDDITEEATSPGGASVSFTEPTAIDDVDGEVPVNCDKGSGDTFPLGTTTVTCSATDAEGNTGNETFDVTVEDTTGPQLTLPSPVVDATSPDGATVPYTATANDLVDGTVAVNCSPTSGGAFAIGTTTVTCSAQDAAGNPTSGTFTVLVRAAADQVYDLAALIKTVNIKQGLANSIDAKLQDALEALTEAKQGDKTSTCGKLGSVDKQIQSQAVVKDITQAQADTLSAKVRQIRAVIGC